MKTVVLDGNYYLHRAHHASKPAALTTKAGVPSGVMKFFYNMMKPICQEQQNIIAVFDADGKNFRHKMFKEYKAGRKETPTEITTQKPDVHKLCAALGLPVLIISGVEADDVLGTIAKHYTDTQQPLTILTGDKDCAQFISEYVDLLDTKSGHRTTLKSLKKDKGITPKQVTYFLALTGDSVDNVPGVKGVGAGFALKWLTKYGTLKNLVAHSDEIPGKIGEKLRAQIDMLRLSFKLVKCKVDVDIDYDDLQRKPSNKKAVQKLLDKYEIRK